MARSGHYLLPSRTGRVLMIPPRHLRPEGADNDSGRSVPDGLSSASPMASSSPPEASIPIADLPPELLAQLIAVPENAPEDFSCVICGHVATNQWNYSPRDYERPPICKSCENIIGYSWTGAARTRTKPTGGTFRDRREAIRIAAIADAIADEATRGHQHGRA